MAEPNAHPTSRERLNELKGLTEEMTTGGSAELDLDQAADISAWLDYISQNIQEIK